MKKISQSTFLLLFLIFLSPNLQAQVNISGTVTDDAGEVYFGVNIVERGTVNGAITDIDGNFTISVEALPTTLVFSYIGYTETSVEVSDASSPIKVVIHAGIGLDEIVVTGNRTKPRTILDSPVPIDNISAEELIAGGKTNMEQMLNYKVPSFNSQNQAISDATAHYDPADLRGLGPSRTLVLINGKRKNQSAQVYLNRTPGKGEVGIDLKSIPTAAIERIEVLRDGASALYGSDAIAGVINIILKKDVDYTTVTTKSGITSQNDGFNFATDINTSVGIGDGGFINLTASYYNQKLTNRAGDVNDTDADYASWLNDNPTAGMIVGQPDMEKVDLFANIEYPLSENTTFYSANGVTHRTGRSFAYYRAPYWRPDVAAAEFLTPAENFVGYHPTFETEIVDNFNSAGIRFGLLGFDADASVTYGRNTVDYTVNRSVNRDYLADHGWSPRTFNPGGYTFQNTIANLDLNRSIGDNVSLGIGFEAKSENFSSREGDHISYYKGGSDSFAGIKPEEVVDESRNSAAGFVDLSVDITENLLVGAAARFENFSDFGNNFSWKANARYKIGKNGAIRGSYSTGFRAPSLHQRYLINSQYIIVQGSPDPQLQGTLANDNPAVKALGVPDLFAETAQNLTAGVTMRIGDHLSASVDYYSINVNDRVLVSSQIQAKEAGDAIDQILSANGVKAVQFFINAGDTKTSGVDVVLNLSNILAGKGRFGALLSANFNKSEIDKINTPAALEAGGYDIFDRREQSLITLSRPNSKILLGLSYKTEKLSIHLDNTRFGEVTVTHASDPANDQVHSAKIITDLGLNYHIAKNLSITANINNIFDVYPDVLDAKTGEDGGGRFVYSSIVQQQNFLGTNYSIGLQMKLVK
jgi:iron complex outermembrane receptor protein